MRSQTCWLQRQQNLLRRPDAWRKQTGWFIGLLLSQQCWAPWKSMTSSRPHATWLKPGLMGQSKKACPSKADNRASGSAHASHSLELHKRRAHAPTPALFRTLHTQTRQEQPQRQWVTLWDACRLCDRHSSPQRAWHSHQGSMHTLSKPQWNR